MLLSASHDLTQYINGNRFTAPSPLDIHQVTVGKTFFQLMEFNLREQMGQVRVAPLDVIFEEGVNRVQPDALFISHEKKGIVQDWIRGAPDIVVEVVSRGTIRTDTHEKKALYEKYGVPAY